jgi:septum formation protein
LAERLILASASPQRRAILTQAGLSFDVRPADVEEESAGEPVVVAENNARAKAEALAAPGLVLGADTLVAVDGEILGKPADAAEARAYLERMSGRAHEVMSGLVVVRHGEERVGLERTTVVFRTLGEAEKERYVNFGEWRDRSGGYAIQTLGSTLVARLEGSVSNVVGLPVGLLADLAPDLFVR